MLKKYCKVKFFVFGFLLLGLTACTTPQAVEEANNIENENNGAETAMEGSFEIPLLVKQGENEEKYVGMVDEGDNVIDLMEKIGDRTELRFQKQESSVGAFIEEINGVKNSVSDNMFWMLYINGESSNVGASMYDLKAGDTVEWRFKDVSDYEAE